MIIGFAGKKQSGKSIAAASIREVARFRQEQFSRPIKMMVGAVLRGHGATTEEVERCLNGDMKETADPRLNGLTPRFMLQSLGHEWARTMLGPDFWLDLMRQRVLPDDNVLIDDVRYPNEVEWIRSVGGYVFRIVRDIPDGGAGPDMHQSEQQELDVDYEIRNDSTVAALRAEVKARYFELMQGRT